MAPKAIRGIGPELCLLAGLVGMRPARAVEVAADAAVWYHTGLPPVLTRWVLVRDPAGGGVPHGPTDLRGRLALARRDLWAQTSYCTSARAKVNVR